MPPPLKPPALRSGDAIRIVSLSSPVEEDRIQKGCEELVRLGYVPKLDRGSVLARDGFFAGTVAARRAAMKQALTEQESRAVICGRGGYGSAYLLDDFDVGLAAAKLFVCYSDLTSLQLFLWKKFRAVAHYGPMVAAGLDKGSGSPGGYDRDSFIRAVTETKERWSLNLSGQAISPGVVEGTLLGGCLTMIETSIGTPWELDTAGAILVLEDRGMKPWQVDRALMHLKQAGKFRGVAGIILGEFPECPAPEGTATVKEVASRILGGLGIPVVWGAPVGHAERPMLTLPLGVQARLTADRATELSILEPACT
jgi:muramoyltetrapeptide carboxypeptidase